MVNRLFSTPERERELQSLENLRQEFCRSVRSGKIEHLGRLFVSDPYVLRSRDLAVAHSFKKIPSARFVISQDDLQGEVTVNILQQMQKKACYFSPEKCQSPHIFSAWIWEVWRREAVKLAWASRTRDEVPLDPDSSDESLFAIIDRLLEMVELEDILSLLPGPIRRCVVGRSHGLLLKEIADKLEITPAGVCYRLLQARRILLRHWSEFDLEQKQHISASSEPDLNSDEEVLAS